MIYKGPAGASVQASGPGTLEESNPCRQYYPPSYATHPALKNQLAAAVQIDQHIVAVRGVLGGREDGG